MDFFEGKQRLAVELGDEVHLGGQESGRNELWSYGPRVPAGRGPATSKGRSRKVRGDPGGEEGRRRVCEVEVHQPAGQEELRVAGHGPRKSLFQVFAEELELFQKQGHQRPGAEVQVQEGGSDGEKQEEEVFGV